MRDGSLYYEYNPNGVNIILEDVSGNSYIAMREVRWSPESQFKFDIRRYFTKQDNEELPGKGVGISDPDHLANMMVATGFGFSHTIIEQLDKRDELVSGLGQFCADMNDQDYAQFKEDIDAERNKAQIDRGMNKEQFMEALG